MMIINDIKKEKQMNKKNLLNKIASIATELDVKGFTKEAKTLDNVLIRVADINPEEYWDKEWRREFREEERTIVPTKKVWEYVKSAHTKELEYALEGGGLDVKNFAEFCWSLKDENLNNMIKNSPDLNWAWLEEAFIDHLEYIQHSKFDSEPE